MDGSLSESQLIHAPWMPLDSVSDLSAMEIRDGLVAGPIEEVDPLEFLESEMNFITSPSESDGHEIGARGTATAQLSLQLQTMVGPLGHSVGPCQEASRPRPQPEETPSPNQEPYVQSLDLPSPRSETSSQQGDEEAPEPHPGPELPDSSQCPATADAISESQRSPGSLHPDQLLDADPKPDSAATPEPAASNASSQDSDVSMNSARSSPDPGDIADSDASSPPKAVPPTLGEGSMETMSEGDLQNFLKALQAQGKLDKVFEGLGYQKAKDSPSKPKKASRPQSTTNENMPHRCTEKSCSKSFRRPCELKYVCSVPASWPLSYVDTRGRKHRKRHEKPYGCTYDRCTKKFGSKNDWKRHENSQHRREVAWKCDEKVREGIDTICGRVLARRETFRNHLQKDHGIADQQTVDHKLEHCRVGQSCEARYWCGFCLKVVEMRDPAWSERFDHIEGHYTGRRGLKKCERSEWKDVSNILPEGLGERQDAMERTDGRSQSTGKRSRAGQDTGERVPKKHRHNQEVVLWTCV